LKPNEMRFSSKSERLKGFYYQNGKEYEYTLEAVIRDDSGRNDTFDVIWECEQPDDAESAEEAVVDEYFEKQVTATSDYDELNKAVDALYSSLTCVWEDNGNIMAEAVRDYVISTLAEITSKTFTEVEVEVERRVVED